MRVRGVGTPPHDSAFSGSRGRLRRGREERRLLPLEASSLAKTHGAERADSVSTAPDTSQGTPGTP